MLACVVGDEGDVSTLAGSGNPAYANDVGAAASFAHVYGVCFDLLGNVMAADTLNHRIRKITTAGLFDCR